MKALESGVVIIQQTIYIYIYRYNTGQDILKIHNNKHIPQYARNTKIGYAIHNTFSTSRSIRYFHGTLII